MKEGKDHLIKSGFFFFQGWNTASQITSKPFSLTLLTWQNASIRARGVTFPFNNWCAFAWFWLWWGTNACSAPFFDSNLARARARKPGLPSSPSSLNEERGRSFNQIRHLSFKGHTWARICVAWHFSGYLFNTISSTILPLFLNPPCWSLNASSTCLCARSPSAPLSPPTVHWKRKTWVLETDLLGS